MRLSAVAVFAILASSAASKAIPVHDGSGALVRRDTHPGGGPPDGGDKGKNERLEVVEKNHLN